MLGQPLSSQSTLPPPDTLPHPLKDSSLVNPCTRDSLQARLARLYPPIILLGKMGLSQSGVAHAGGSAAVTFSLTFCQPAGARILTLVTKSLPSAHLCAHFPHTLSTAPDCLQFDLFT